MTRPDPIALVSSARGRYPKDAGDIRPGPDANVSSAPLCQRVRVSSLMLGDRSNQCMVSMAEVVWGGIC